MLSYFVTNENRFHIRNNYAIVIFLANEHFNFVSQTHTRHPLYLLTDIQIQFLHQIDGGFWFSCMSEYTSHFKGNRSHIRAAIMCVATKTFTYTHTHAKNKFTNPSSHAQQRASSFIQRCILCTPNILLHIFCKRGICIRVYIYSRI